MTIPPRPYGYSASRKPGYEPGHGANGFEARELIQKDPPVLIRFDIMMKPVDI
jgi:hypothetical protein